MEVRRGGGKRKDFSGQEKRTFIYAGVNASNKI